MGYFVRIKQARFNKQWVWTPTQPAIIQQCVPQWNVRKGVIAKMGDREFYNYQADELRVSLYQLQTYSRYGTIEVPEEGTPERVVIDNAVSWVCNWRTCLTYKAHKRKDGVVMIPWRGLFYWSGHEPEGFGDNILWIYDEVTVKGKKYLWAATFQFPPILTKKLNPATHPHLFAHLNFVNRKNVIFKTGTTGDNTMAFNLSKGGVCIPRDCTEKA